MPAPASPSVLDPFLAAVAAARQPRVVTSQWPYRRLQQRAALDELHVLDEAFETIAARRRVVVDRLEQLGDELHPRSERRHVSRRRFVDVAPPVPPPEDAPELQGRDLRATCLAILRRHGTLRLRELHDLVHRYGYTVSGPRPVQRLADAMAYEMSMGRCARVARGVYEAVCGVDDGGVDVALGEPVAWEDPDAEEAMIDVAVADQAARWQAGEDGWPPDAQARKEYRDPQVVESVAEIRRHLAALEGERLVASVRAATSDPLVPYPTPADNSLLAHWQRFVDESPPTDRMRLAWEEPEWSRRRRASAMDGPDDSPEPHEPPEPPADRDRPT